jgi:hypothetical protein
MFGYRLEAVLAGLFNSPVYLFDSIGLLNSVILAKPSITGLNKYQPLLRLTPGL